MSMFWRGLVGYLPANIVQGVVGLLSVVVFTRVLTPAAYGAYAVAFSAASLAHTLVFTWVEAAMARFYAKEAAAGRLEDHFAAIYRTFAGLAAAFLVVAGLVAWLLPLEPVLKGAVAAGLLCVPLRSLAKLAQEHRRAAGRIRPSALLDIGQSSGAFVIGAGLAAAACVAAVLPGELKLAGKGHFDPARAREQASLMLLICLPAAVGLALVAQPLAGLMVGQGLRDGAARVTPWIAASGFFAGVNTHYLNTAFTLARRTKLLLVALAIPAAVNVALTLVMIPRFGLDGAMWATTASYVVGSCASLALGRGAIALPIPWSALMRCGAAAAIMAAAVRLVPAWGGAPELLAKAALGAVVYGLCAFLLDAAGVRSRRLQMVRALQGAPA